MLQDTNTLLSYKKANETDELMAYCGIILPHYNEVDNFVGYCGIIF
jgi:hypothetical protein